MTIHTGIASNYTGKWFFLFCAPSVLISLRVCGYTNPPLQFTESNVIGKVKWPGRPIENCRVRMHVSSTRWQWQYCQESEGGTVWGGILLVTFRLL